MRYIFLSPHLDDVSLSCGGIVNNLFQSNNDVEIWTLFAGILKTNNLTPFAQSLHDRWKLPYDAPQARREEDILSCSILGARHRHFNYLDCIYRVDDQNKPIVVKEEDLYQAIPPTQIHLVEEIQNLILSLVNDEDIIISPMAIGDHIDHRILLKSIQNLNLKNTRFYEDFPYIQKSQPIDSNLSTLCANKYELSSENIIKWHESVAAHTSQISTFWDSQDHMRNQIKQFFMNGGGTCLWEQKI